MTVICNVLIYREIHEISLAEMTREISSKWLSCRELQITAGYLEGRKGEIKKAGISLCQPSSV